MKQNLWKSMIRGDSSLLRVYEVIRTDPSKELTMGEIPIELLNPKPNNIKEKGDNNYEETSHEEYSQARAKVCQS